MNDIFEDLIGIFKPGTFQFVDGGIEFEFSEECKGILDKCQIQYAQIKHGAYLRIELDDLQFGIYETYSDYLKVEEVNKNRDNIVFEKGKVSYSLIGDKTYVDFQLKEDSYFFTNARCYFDLISFIDSKKSETEDAFHFVDYVNEGARKFVFTSLSDRGRVIVEYAKNVPLMNADFDYRTTVDEFKACFNEEGTHLPKFLKSSIIDNGSRFGKDERMYKIFEGLKDILYSAKVKFEIYINNLSIDKIVKEYEEYKSKYFKELTEILSNLTQKIIGLPLLIAGTLFAIEKVKDSVEFLWVLIVVTLVTNIYLVTLLKINFKELYHIEASVERDFRKLMENKFFDKFKSEKKPFERIRVRITDKSRALRTICESYYWILSVSNVVTIDLILSYLKIETGVIVLLSFIAGVFILHFKNEVTLNSED